MTQVLDDLGNLTDEWKEKFRTYKKNVNYPTLQDISNLLDHRVRASQCGNAIRNGYGVADQTRREVIAVAKYIGYIPAAQKWEGKTWNWRQRSKQNTSF